MTANLIWCHDCHQAVEGVILASGVRAYLAYEPMAHAHYERYGHYPDRVHVTPGDAKALRRVGKER